MSHQAASSSASTVPLNGDIDFDAIDATVDLLSLMELNNHRDPRFRLITHVQSLLTKPYHEVRSWRHPVDWRSSWSSQGKTLSAKRLLVVALTPCQKVKGVGLDDVAVQKIRSEIEDRCNKGVVSVSARPRTQSFVMVIVGHYTRKWKEPFASPIPKTQLVAKQHFMTLAHLILTCKILDFEWSQLEMSRSLSDVPHFEFALPMPPRLMVEILDPYDKADPETGLRGPSVSFLYRSGVLSLQTEAKGALGAKRKRPENANTPNDGVSGGRSSDEEREEEEVAESLEVMDDKLDVVDALLYGRKRKRITSCTGGAMGEP